MAIVRKVLRSLPSIFFVIAFLLFLLTSNIRIAFNSLSFYTWEFHRQQVDQTTGLTFNQLADAGRQIRDYFNSDQEPLDVQVTRADGQRVALFDQREITHMGDVKRLVQRFYALQEACLVFLFLWVVVGSFVQRKSRQSGLFQIRRLALRASLLTTAVILVAGVVVTVAFDPIFILFHEISFSNNLWELDPATSHLLQMFPDQFWVEATLLIALSTIAEALAVGAAALVMGRWQRRRRAPAMVH